MDSLKSIVNTIVRVDPPVLKDNQPFDVDWIIISNLREGSAEEFSLATVSAAQGLIRPLRQPQVISFQPERSADTKSASKGRLFLNCQLTMPPKG